MAHGAHVARRVYGGRAADHFRIRASQWKSMVDCSASSELDGHDHMDHDERGAILARRELHCDCVVTPDRAAVEPRGLHESRHSHRAQ